MAVRALVFDVFGTLVDWRSGIAEAFRTSEVPGDPYELADAWRARYRPILDEVNEGARPWGDFDDLHHVTLDALLAEQGVDLPVEERREAGGRVAPAGPVARRPEGPRGAAPPVRRRRRSPTATPRCSSTSRATATCASTASSRRSSRAPTSLRPRSTRPRRGCSDVEPGELMLVAAHPRDLAGARAAGLRTAFVDRPLEYGPGSPPARTRTRTSRSPTYSSWRSGCRSERYGLERHRALDDACVRGGVRGGRADHQRDSAGRSECATSLRLELDAHLRDARRGQAGRVASDHHEPLSPQEPPRRRARLALIRSAIVTAHASEQVTGTTSPLRNTDRRAYEDLKAIESPGAATASAPPWPAAEAEAEAEAAAAHSRNRSVNPQRRR